MLLIEIGKKYTADLMSLTKFKKIIGMWEKLPQNMEVKVSLMEFLLPTQWRFAGFFLFQILHFTMVFRGIGISKHFRLVFS